MSQLRPGGQLGKFQFGPSKKKKNEKVPIHLVTFLLLLVFSTK